MDENQIYYLGRVEKNTIVLKQNSNSNFAELQLNSDLNNAIAMRLYRTTQSNVANSLKNKPSSIQSGEMIIA